VPGELPNIRTGWCARIKGELHGEGESVRQDHRLGATATTALLSSAWYERTNRRTWRADERADADRTFKFRRADHKMCDAKRTQIKRLRSAPLNAIQNNGAAPSGAPRFNERCEWLNRAEFT
jgi:hypothetical protein